MKLNSLLSSAFLGLCLQSSPADTIASGDLTGRWPTPTSGAKFGFAYGLSNYVFETSSLTPAQVGTTFRVDQSTDPDFAEVVDHLTNGKDEQVYLTFFTPLMWGTGMPETSFFTQRPQGQPDLAGYAVSRIDLTINQWTDAGYSFTISVMGQAATVPEPNVTCNWLTACVILGAVGGYSRRRGNFSGRSH